MTQLKTPLVLFMIVAALSLQSVKCHGLEDYSDEYLWCKAKRLTELPIEGLSRMGYFVLKNPVKAALFTLLTFMNPAPVAAALFCNCECTSTGVVLYRIYMPPPLSCDPCMEALCPYECNLPNQPTAPERCRQICNNLDGIINLSSIQATCQ